MSLLLGQPTFAQSSENQQMTFEGTLTDVNGNPLSLAGVTLNFYISANGCYLYGESSATAGDNQGQLSHRFGNGTLISGSPNSFSQNLFFGNVTGTTTFAGNNCSVTASDTRLAQVYYPAQNITATIKLGTVPYAQNATMFGGKVPAEFIQTNTDTNTLFYGGITGQYLTKGVSGFTWTNNTLTASQVSAALGYTPASATTALTSAAINTALGYTPASASALANYAVKSNNLSDLTSATLARNNLGLGTLATKNSVNLGSAEVTGTLPATNLPAFSGDVITVAGSATTTVQRLRGVALSATAPTSGQVMLYNGTAWAPTSIPSNVGTVTIVSSANSDITITNNSTTPVLTLNVGQGASQIIRLDSSGRIPAVDASLLTSLNASQLTIGTLPAARLPALTGDVLSTVGSSTVTVNRIRGINVAATAPTSGQVLSYNGSQWTPTAAATGSVTNINTGTGLTGGPITSTGTISVNFGSTSGTVAAGNDARIVGALQSANNLNDLGSASSARTNLGLGSFATANSVDLGSASATGIIADARLANQTNVTSGTQYTKVTVDGKGRVINGGQISTTDINTALGFAPASASALANYAVRANNLSDLTSSATARTNLGLGALATKSIVQLTADVSGVLPIANGGSKWTGNLGSIYTVSNTTIGSSTAFTNVGLYVAAPVSTGSTVAASINNPNANGFGLKVNVENNSASRYGLLVSALGINNFVVLNNGNVGVGPSDVTARLHIASGTTTLAPFRIDGGNLLTTPVSGSIESDGTSLFYTNSSAQRRRLAGGVAANTIDNVSKMTFTGNILLEGNTAGTTPAITIQNLGASTVGLQVNENVVVSGSIKLSQDGLDSTVACTAADEGKQRYNKTYKTMEYCDGAYWQGMSGITHCHSTGVSYTLVGTPGTGSAFCMSKNSESATTYVNAVTTCQNRTTTRNNARPYLCSEVNYQIACKQYSVFNTQAETFLPGFRSTYYWIPAAYDGTNMFVLRYTTATAGVCNVSDMGNTNVSETSNQSYRCCYN